MNTKIKNIVIVLIIIAGGYGLMKYLASKKEEPSKIVPPRVKRYVKVDTVSYSSIETSVEGFGKVITTHSVNLVAEVGGELISGDIQLKSAQNFSKGQLIYKINDKEARMNLLAQKSEFMNLIAMILPDLKLDYPENYFQWEKYLQNLNINNTLSDLPEITNVKEKTFLSNKKILTQYFNIKSLEERLSKYTFYAPFSGSIVELKTQSGSIVNPGTQIGRIIRTEEMEVEIPIKVESIGWVQAGAKVFLSSQDQTLTWEGIVTRIGDYVDPNTQAISVFVNVKPNLKSKIFDGFYLKAKIPGRTIEKAMEIPRIALIGNNLVYTVENGKLKLKEVQIKKINSEFIIMSGLQEGELVVVETIVNAIENMEVFVAKE